LTAGGVARVRNGLALGCPGVRWNHWWRGDPVVHAEIHGKPLSMTDRNSLTVHGNGSQHTRVPVDAYSRYESTFVWYWLFGDVTLIRWGLAPSDG
jgi:hypothetical protein